MTSTGAVRLFDNIHTPTPTVADTMTTKAGVRHIALLAIFSLFVFCFVAMIGSWWAASVVWLSTAMAVGMTTTSLFVKFCPSPGCKGPLFPSVVTPRGGLSGDPATAKAPIWGVGDDCWDTDRNRSSSSFWFGCAYIPDDASFVVTMDSNACLSMVLMFLQFSRPLGLFI